MPLRFSLLLSLPILAHIARRLLVPLLATALALVALPARANPAIQHWTLDNGARVYFVETRALPLVDIDISFAAGSAYDPADKSGLAAFVRSLLETGTSMLDEEAIATAFAELGARFGGTVDNDRASLTLRTLSHAAERERSVALLAQLLAAPAYPAAQLERERTRAIAALRDALTQPDTLAARAFSAGVFGNHPYGLNFTEATLNALSQIDLIAFHQRFYTAPNASVSIVGDLSRDEADAVARTLTASLPAGIAAPTLAVPVQPAASETRIPHPAEQAHISLGLVGMSRDDPDYYPLLVGNYVLGGGGFVSRLMQEVREKRGFAYSVYSYFAPQRVPGLFEIGLQTRGSQADEALAVARQVLAGFVADGPTAAELQAAKDNYINGFGLRLDSNAKVLTYVALIGFYRLPLDWLDRYPEHVAAVTATQVRDAFQRRVKAEHLVVVIAGGDGDRAPAAEPATTGMQPGIAPAPADLQAPAPVHDAP